MQKTNFTLHLNSGKKIFENLYRAHMKITKKTFSLIELLVAISIITILAGMVIGGLNAVSEKNNITDTRSTIMLTQDALLKYYQDNGGYPLNGSGRHEFHSDGGGDFTDTLLKELQAYGAPVIPDPNDSSDIGIYDAWLRPIYIIFPDTYTSGAVTTTDPDSTSQRPEAKSYSLNGSTVYYNQRTFQIISRGSDELFGDPNLGTNNQHRKNEADNVYNFEDITDN